MITAIILAAGSSKRMGMSVKKPFIPLNGLPILSYSLKVFDESKEIDEIYLAIAKSDMEKCQSNIIQPLQLKHHIKLVKGGPTRQSSALKALKAVKNKNGLVLIHDAARPFITKKLIDRCIKGVKKTGACIPVVPISDSLKKSNKLDSFAKAITRENTWLAQTPQTFDFTLIFNAHKKAKKCCLCKTDDSSIVETFGGSVSMVQGNSYNIKVTTKHDLILAKAISKIKLSLF